MLKFLGFSVVLFFFSFAAYSQNTKGDRPIKNDRQIRETKVKTVRKKEKRRTRDVANRRLRTRNESSANRANAKYPQPSPYSAGKKKHIEKSARPRGRIFNESPRESRVKPWKGDLSGYPIKRVKPSRTDAARNNVYPQKGPYVRYARKQPKKKPEVYSRTIRGTKFIRQQPRSQEHRWTGGADKGPLKNKSATGTVRNVYPKKDVYPLYSRKQLQRRDNAVSNRKELAQVRRFSRPVRTGGSQGSMYPAPVSRPFIQRGKKNVYWGKFSKKEKPFTTDLTGAPVRGRNYKSSVPGFVGRDTLKFFGRKPFGDRSTRLAGGYQTATKKGQRSWKGDISGWKLRKGRKGINEGVGEFVFPRLLSISEKGENRGKKTPGSGFKTRTTKGERAQFKSVPTMYLERNYDGKVKHGIKPPKAGGGSISGRLWNNRGQSTSMRAAGLGSIAAAGFKGQNQVRAGFSRQGTGYSGNIKRSSLQGYSREGVNYSGTIKRSGIRGFSKAGSNYSGTINRSSIRGFSREGGNYSGNIKGNQARGFSREGGNYSGTIRRSSLQGFSKEGSNYSGTIRRSSIRGFSRDGVDYSGNIRRSDVRGFSKEGAGYSGNLKSRRPDKGGGTLSTLPWNNSKQSTTLREITPSGRSALRYSGNTLRIGPVKSFEDHGEGYSGNMKRSSLRGFGRQGSDFAGNYKSKRPEKGGGSLSGKHWNNEKQALEVKIPISGQGANFAGRLKIKQPEKGGGSVSGKHWNNEKQALVVKIPLSGQGANFAGHLKIKQPEKGGGSVSGKHWNNDKQTLASRTPQSNDAKAVNYSGTIALSRFKKNYVQTPNSSKASIKKLPLKSSVKAGEYARSMKQYWSYKHNPHSAEDALKVHSSGKALARANDFQGNTKMHKYSGSQLHPDAQFAHSDRDNVKSERTLLMNVKLKWSKLFRKSENQPENLKEKNKRPRYDKREKGLWYD